MPELSSKKKVQSFIGMINYLSNSLPDYLNYLNPSENYQKKEFPLTEDQNIEKPSLWLRKN